MSDALMILPAVQTPTPSAPAPAPASASAPAANRSADSSAKAIDAIPTDSAKDTDKESTEKAAEFSEVLASIVSSFVAVRKVDVNVTETAGNAEPSITGEIATAQTPALSLWDVNSMTPSLTGVQQDLAGAPFADALSLQQIAADSMPKELIAQATEALKARIEASGADTARGVELGEGLESGKGVDLGKVIDLGKVVEPDKGVELGKAEDVPLGKVETATRPDTLAAPAAVLPESTPQVALETPAPAQIQAAEPEKPQLPREAKIVSDTIVAPVAPKEATVSSTRIVETASTQTQDEALAQNAQPKQTKAEAARASAQASAFSANDAKVPVKGSDEIAEGQFSALRPASSAPSRSADERQALPVKKAETVGKEFSESQSAISPPATETRSVETAQKTSEPRLAAASPAQQVSEAAQAAQRNGVRTLELELKPDGLGTLRLKISGPVRGTSGDGLQIEIQALNPKAHALLIDHMSELRSALGQWEIRLMPPVTTQDFSGVMAGSESRGNSQSGSHRQNGQGQPERHARDAEPDESFAEQFGSSAGN